MTVSWNPSDERHEERYGDPVPARPSVDAGRLWAGGLAAAVVAGLAGLVGVLVVRGVFDVEFLAPDRTGIWGDATTAWLVVAATGGALVATALLHLLLLAAPEPFRFFRWIVGLVTVALAVWPFVTSAALAAKISSAVVYAVIGVAIGSLVGGAGARSLRRATPRGPR